MKYRIAWQNKRNCKICGHAEITYSSRSVAQAWADQANENDTDNEYFVEMVSDAGVTATKIIETQKNLTLSRCIDWDFSLN